MIFARRRVEQKIQVSDTDLIRKNRIQHLKWLGHVEHQHEVFESKARNCSEIDGECCYKTDFEKVFDMFWIDGFFFLR